MEYDKTVGPPNWEKKFKKLSKEHDALQKAFDNVEYELMKIKFKLNIKLDCIGTPPGKGKISLP